MHARQISILGLERYSLDVQIIEGAVGGENAFVPGSCDPGVKRIEGCHVVLVEVRRSSENSLRIGFRTDRDQFQEIGDKPRNVEIEPFALIVGADEELGVGEDRCVEVFALEGGVGTRRGSVRLRTRFERLDTYTE